MKRFVSCFFALVLVLFVSNPVRGALIDLSLEPSSLVVDIGNIFSVKFFARSTPSEVFSGAQADLLWNPSQFELLGKTDDGPYTWFASFFGGPQSVTFADGDANYAALALAPLPITDLHITTFNFKAVGLGAGTISLANAIVADDSGLGLNIVGNTFDATVSVVPEPSTIVLFGVGMLGALGISWRRRKKAA